MNRILNSKKLLIIIFLIFVFSFLYYFDLPRSHVDDIWFLDPAINLSEHGELKAPRLKPFFSKFSSDFFFLAMPFYSYILGGWFKLFGLTTHSIISFQYIIYLLNIILLFKWLRTKGLSFNISAFSALIFMVQNLSFGFRPEPLGFCFMFAGLLMLQNCKMLNLFLGFFLLGVAVFTSHNALAIAFSLTFFAVYVHYENSKLNPNLFKRVLTSFILSSLLISLLFSFSINFSFYQFYEQINWMIQNRSMELGSALPYIFHDLLKYWNPYQFLPIYIIFFIVTIWLLYRNKILARQTLLFLLSLVTSVGLHFLLRPGMYLISLFLVWILILTFISIIKVPIELRRFILIALTGLFLFQNSHLLLSLLCTDSIDRQSLELFEKNARSISENTKNIVVDDITARYVFGFNYPPNTQAALMDITPPPSKNNIWIVSPYRTAHHFPEYNTSFEKFKLFGREFNLLSQNPYEIIVLGR